jgi:PAS domain S-box-containing protein
VLDSRAEHVFAMERYRGRVEVGFTEAEIGNDHQRAFEYVKSLEDSEYYLSDIHLETAHGEPIEPLNPVVDIATPIFNQQGVLIGALVFTYKLNGLFNEMAAMSAQTHSEITLLDNGGHHFVSNTGKANASSLLPSTPPIFDSRPEWKALLNSKKPSQSFDGKYLTTARPFCPVHTCEGINNKDNHHWLLVSEQNMDAIQATIPMGPRWYLLYALIGILLAIATITIYVAWQLMTANISLSRAKKQLESQDNLLTTFIESNPAMVYVKNREGEYRIANHAYAEHVGEDLSEIIGKKDFDLHNIDFDKSSNHITLDQMVIHFGQIKVSEEAWPNADDEQINFLITRFPITNSDTGAIDLMGVIAVDVTDRDRARAEVSKQQALFKVLVNASPDAILIVDSYGAINFSNLQAAEMFSSTETDLQGKKIFSLIDSDVIHGYLSAKHQNDIEQPEESKTKAITHMVQAKNADDEVFDCELRMSPIFINDQQMTMCLVRDVTRHLRMEEHLRQSQKMEAIGHLTGGVAHDFNNLLGIVIGNLDMLASLYEDDEKAQKRINAALKASLSGAELTKRLLAFARKQALQPEPVDIETAFDELTPILDRTLKGDIDLQVNVQSNMLPAFMDQAEFENVVLNMAINSRDAMPDGGVLNIEVDEVELDEDFMRTSSEPLEPGKYIHLAISDTGSGIEPHVLKHIFEPFFTTKEKGKGTGLGLAMAHGFAKQSKGLIKAYSELNVGTTFHLYLPTTHGQGNNLTPLSNTVENIPTGDETILVVDDEEELADIASAYLEELGYKTYTTYSGEQALKKLSEEPGISMVITDVVMPNGMDGLDLHQKVSQLFPSIVVVYASGFSADAIANKRGVNLKADLITKPYRKARLAQIVRSNLDKKEDS